MQTLEATKTNTETKAQDYEDWVVDKIKASLAQAERGEFVPEKEMEEFFNKWK